MSELPFAVYNPNNLPVESLPVIYGFNNGGRPGWYHAQLIAEDGTGLGGHLCSSEAFIYSDLGLLEGTRPDRHETFKKHYPNGYRMAFVPHDEVEKTEPLLKAFELNRAQVKAEETTQPPQSPVKE